MQLETWLEVNIFQPFLDIMSAHYNEHFYDIYSFSYVEVAVCMHFIPWYLMEGNYWIVEDVSRHFELWNKTVQ
jgi:hypothetical protein